MSDPYPCSQSSRFHRVHPGSTLDIRWAGALWVALVAGSFAGCGAEDTVVSGPRGGVGHAGR